MDFPTVGEITLGSASIKGTGLLYPAVCFSVATCIVQFITRYRYLTSVLLYIMNGRKLDRCNIFVCSKMCSNATWCKEKLALVLPDTPPFVPRQYGWCAVVGNSGDLLQDLFGAEIDAYDAVIRMNGAPVEVEKPLSLFKSTLVNSAVMMPYWLGSFLNTQIPCH